MSGKVFFLGRIASENKIPMNKIPDKTNKIIG